MTQESAILVFVIIIVTGIVSYKGFNDSLFFSRYEFHVGNIFGYKEYHRMVTSGFLHGDWMHLLFNMFCFMSFGEFLEKSKGWPCLLLIYFGSMIGGSFLAGIVHRNHPDYRAIGASGAVSGILFSAVFLLPGMGVSPLFLPISIPGYLFAIIYVGISIYGIKSQAGRIGHEAHLGGAISGMLLTALFYPQTVAAQPYLFCAISIAFAGFCYYLFKNPLMLSGVNVFKPTIIENYKKKKATQQNYNDREEMDRLLAKVNEHGLPGLSDKEKDRLNEIAKRLKEKNK